MDFHFKKTPSLRNKQSAATPTPLPTSLKNTFIVTVALKLYYIAILEPPQWFGYSSNASEHRGITADEVPCPLFPTQKPIYATARTS